MKSRKPPSGAMTIALPGDQWTREALQMLAETSRAEQDWHADNGRSKRSDAFRCIADAFEKSLKVPL